MILIALLPLFFLLQLPIGRVCVSHYGMLHRFCVFSHDELVCAMAADPDKLDISVAASTYQDMLRMVESEKGLRKSLLDWVCIFFFSVRFIT